jgi:hypothetical protein
MADAATALAEFAPVGTLPAVAPKPRWSLATKIAFRFFTVYFALYVVTTQMIGGFVPFVDVPPLIYLEPVAWLVKWTALNVFGITTTLVVTGSGSGDKTFDWVQVALLLATAAATTVVWSVLRRRTPHYERGHTRYRVFLRFALGTTMLGYGAAKFIPLQMPFPFLDRLLEPYGHFSPMGVLWAQIGASPAYEIFLGATEALAGVLLFIPLTATLGAIVAFACAFQVFMVNMTYDVPVKLFSFQLILMSLFLLAPEARRLLNVIVLNRGAEASSLPPLGSTPQAIRTWTALQIAFGLLLFVAAAKGSIDARSQYGDLRPKSPLYGIWDVTYLSIDGVERAPRLDDYDRWRRVVFEFPTSVSMHRMDATVTRYAVKLDEAAKAIALTRPADAKWTGNLTYERPDPTHLILKGDMGGTTIEMRTELFPREKFLLVSRGFNWVQEYPFNR